MRTIALTIISIFALGLSSFANQLEFRSTDNARFWVIINGVYLNNHAQSYVSNIRVEDDYVNVKIKFENSHIPSIRKEISTHAKHSHIKTFNISYIGHNRYELRKKRHHVSHNNGSHHKGNVYHKKHHSPANTCKPIRTNPSCATAKPMMCNAEFMSLKQRIRRESFDKDKLMTAKLGISSYYLTTEQVRQIAHLFTFGGYKLDFLEYTYYYTTDKHNYYKLSSVFTFQSKKDEFHRFLATR